MKLLLMGEVLRVATNFATGFETVRLGFEINATRTDKESSELTANDSEQRDNSKTKSLKNSEYISQFDVRLNFTKFLPLQRH